MPRVTIKWGLHTEPEDSTITYEFDTPEELDAFLEGVAECDGWMDYTIVSNSLEDEGEPQG